MSTQSSLSLRRRHQLVRRVLRERLGHAAFDGLLSLSGPGECFVAGGMVRDLLMNRVEQIKDVDLFVAESLEASVVQHFAQHGQLGKGPFGSWRWVPDVSVGYADLMVIERFDNGVGLGGTMLSCLEQFDVTINAIAMDLVTGHFEFVPQALLDIPGRVLRAVRLDYPDEPISKDTVLTRNAVLWHRMVRIQKRLGLQIEAQTQQWLDAHQAYQSQELTYLRVFDPALLNMHAAHRG